MTVQEYDRINDEGRLKILPCLPGQHVYFIGRDRHIPELCSVQGYYFTLRESYVKLYPIMQPKNWLGNRSMYYKVQFSSLNKLWFLTIDEAERARNGR